MIKEKIRDFNIDLIAKDFKQNKLEKIKYLQVESNLNLKKKNVSDVKKLKYKITQSLGVFPKLILAKKSVSEWNLREGQPCGCMITLRNTKEIERAYKVLLLISLLKGKNIWTGIESLITIDEKPIVEKNTSESINISDEYCLHITFLSHPLLASYLSFVSNHK